MKMQSPPIILYRIGNWFQRKNFRVIAKSISWLNRFLYSVWLPSSATIGKNFKLGYWGLGVVIHSKCIIGDNVLVAQNVTIGRNFGDIEVPKIGHDVYIGAGSVIFGEITIGDNVIIGSNSLINKSVPPNCTVVGNPMKVIQWDRIQRYYELK
jgi:serine O-acetyltransferase